MKARDLILLMILGAMWGSSFLFIKVSVAEISPTFVVAARFAFAVLTLLVALPFLGRLSGAAAPSSPTPRNSGGPCWSSAH